MKKRKHGERESRHSRKKQFGQEQNDHQGSPGTRGILVTSGMRENNKDVMRDERGHGARSPTSGRLPHDDYVQRWLAQTIQEVDVPSNAGLDSRKENVSRHVDPGGPSRGFDFEQFPQVKDYDSNKERTSARDKRRKRMLESSSDCSFLELALASDPRPQTTHNVVERIEIQEESKTRRQSRKLERSVGLESSVVSLSINPQVGCFEKRRRHKTREDRYEPKKALVDPKSQVNREKQRERREKSKSHRKVPRNTGEDLLHQFSSKSVGLDRLTMPPSHTVGLFKNGRASSPARRRGLPDLAFSEMEFLRRSKQRPAKMEEKKSLSKSQEKEKRRSERAQNEISEYFKPSTNVRVEVEKADRQQASYTSNVDYNLRQGEIGKDRYQSSDLSKERFLGLDRRHAFEQLAAMPHLRGQMVQLGVAPDMTRKLSDRDTTYYTWSDSARSPVVSQNKKMTGSVVSTTPESVRQMLNDTGIFRNTGVDRTTGGMHERARNKPVRPEVQMKTPRFSKIPNCVSPATPARKSSHTNIQSRRPPEAAEPALRIDPSSHEVQERHLYESGSRARDGGEVHRPAKPTIQHYSAESGWQEHSTFREDMMCSHLSKVEASQQGISRQVIAQGAYVKHSPTTNAAIRSAEPPEADKMMPQQQNVELMIHKETNAEIPVHLPHPSRGVEREEEYAYIAEIDKTKSLPDPCVNQGDPLQSSMATISDPSAKYHLDTILVTTGVPIPSRTLETIPDLPFTYERAKSGLDQTGGTNIEGSVHPAVRVHVFGGLPVRGSWQGGVSRPTSSYAISPPLIVEPLYSHQLENRIPYSLINQHQDQHRGKLQEQIINRFDTHSMGHTHNEEGEPYDAFEGECEQINDTADPHDYDLMFSNEGYSECYVEVEEEDPTPSEPLNNDISDQDVTREDLYEGGQSPCLLDQQQSLVMSANLNGEAHYYYLSHEPLRELEREEESRKHYDLGRFWRPHRQY